MIEFPLLLIAYFSTLGLVFTYFALKDKDLIKAIIFSTIQSISYALIYGTLLAPDILLVYLAVGFGIYPILLLYAVSKTRRYEKK
ncbi:MAG: sodium:proton antiporter [Thermoprotei archaeon]|nr:MAG: sodium:proton antiporter [Thermoprotei archaeon]